MVPLWTTARRHTQAVVSLPTDGIVRAAVGVATPVTSFCRERKGSVVIRSRAAVYLDVHALCNFLSCLSFVMGPAESHSLVTSSDAAPPDTSVDLFECERALERAAEERGARRGRQQGAAHAQADGYQHGHAHGYAFARELAFYEAAAEWWLRALDDSPPPPPSDCRSERPLRSLSPRERTRLRAAAIALRDAAALLRPQLEHLIAALPDDTASATTASVSLPTVEERFGPLRAAFKRLAITSGADMQAPTLSADASEASQPPEF